jgi:cobalt-zinc-cadmium efflux system outer membrane protein
MSYPSFAPARRAYVRIGRPFLLSLAAISATTTFAADTTPLSLDAAVHLAEMHAPALDARQAAFESAEHVIGPAGQLPDPELVVGIDSLPVSTGDAFSLTRDSMTTRHVGIEQQFPRREKRRLRTERAEAGAAREQALLTNERLSVREATARAWIVRKTAEQRLALLQALQPRAETQIAAATAAFSAGRSSAADAIAAKSAQASLEDRISQAEQALEEAKAEFARWLPDAADRPLGDATDWTDLGVDPNALLTHIGQHRELLAYDASEQMANADVALARAEKRPDWSLEFGYAQRGPQFSNLISIEVRVPLPLFAASRQDPTIAAKEAAVAQIEAEREGARRMHTAELRKTLAAWRSATDRVHRYEHEILPLADDRADASLAAYRGGRGDLQASLTALDNAVEQRVAYTELLNTLGQSWAALHFAFPEEH